MSYFIESNPTLDAYWRGIILFGQNSAAYKFALAKSLLEISNSEETFISLEDLAKPFSKNILDHLLISDKQGTSKTSSFLNTCRDYNSGKIKQTELIETTVRLGFVNVIDAFHVVNREEITERFFIDERKTKNGITISDNLFLLKNGVQFENLDFEVEARWRLVEHAWSVGLAPHLLQVKYNPNDGLLFSTNQQNARVDVTSAREALNGYQKGKCFYCFKDISISEFSSRKMEVDHFFPHILKEHIPTINLDGVWNLVLSCEECNRGVSGKFSKVPTLNYLERLERRNSYLIDSHHPLRETLINQTGYSSQARLKFLQEVDSFAISHMLHRWSPSNEEETAF